MSPFIETMYRTTVAFIGILVYARILGKQQMSQMTFYDYVTGITFGSIAAAITVEPNDKLWLLVWALTIFALLDYLSGIITEKSRPLRKLIEGEPTILVHNGKIMEHNMAKIRYNMENLMMQLREKDVFDISDVEFA
ncbi:MAG: YetF domain-containing protein, partial [Syntrophomonas sp.]